jgi:hypothetical protein
VLCEGLILNVNVVRTSTVHCNQIRFICLRQMPLVLFVVHPQPHTNGKIGEAVL